MHSAGHRRNILNPRFRDIGVGIAAGVPPGGMTGAHLRDGLRHASGLGTVRRPMADVQPLRALHYDLAVAGSLHAVAAPPYDVIDPEQRAELAARSPYNVVARRPARAGEGGDPYAEAARAARAVAAPTARSSATTSRRSGRCTQDYTGPDGRALHAPRLLRARARRGLRPRPDPPARAHAPGPEGGPPAASRARRRPTSRRSSASTTTPATRPGARSSRTPRRARAARPTDDDGTVNRLWRVADPAAIAAVHDALDGAELLIADGHHRYETARVYADEIGGEGEHRYVLMCLVALQDPGLTVFPTHRLLSRRHDPTAGGARGKRCASYFDIEPIEQSELRAARRRRPADDGLHRRPLHSSPSA